MAVLEGDFEIPKVGKIPKKVAIPVAAGAAAFVAWKFWQARSGTGSDGDDATSTIADGEFGAVDSSIPGVLNPYPSSFSSGSTGSSSSSTTGDRNGDGIIGPGEFTTNGEWTEYVTSRLVQSDTWSYTDIVIALGNGLAGKPTSDSQQAILRAATAVGGQPPVGSITYVSGGNTDLTVAPSGVTAGSVTQNSAAISFGAVSGATSYQLFRNGAAVATGSGSPITLEGLSPNTSYTVAVAGVTSSGKIGPKSTAVTVKTPAYTMAKPAAPSISGVTSTTATARVAAVPHADEFYWYLNGKMAGSTQGVQWAITGLKAKTKYTVAAQARGFNQPAGPVGPITTFTTK